MIRVSCPDCGLGYAIPDNRLGNSKAMFRCKRCNAQIIAEPRSQTPPPTVDKPAPKPAASPARPTAARPLVIKPVLAVPRAAKAGAATTATAKAGTAAKAGTVTTAAKAGSTTTTANAGIGAATAAAPIKHDPIEFDWDDLDVGTGRRRLAKADSGLRVKPAASEGWLVELGEDVIETVQLAELCELYAHGTVGPSTPVRAAGATEWSRAPDIPEIASALTERGLPLLPRLDLRGDDDEADCTAPTNTLDASELWAAVGVDDRETAVIDSRRLVKQALASVTADDPSSESAIPTVPPPPIAHEQTDGDQTSGDSERPSAVRLDDEDDLTLLYKKPTDASESRASESPAPEPARVVDPFAQTERVPIQQTPASWQAPATPASAHQSTVGYLALVVLLAVVAFGAAVAATMAAFDLFAGSPSASEQR
jgi:hypothetical protein